MFASFAPATDPHYVVAAVFEQSGYGASVAAPAVEQEYTTLFGLNKPPQQGSCTSASSSTTSTTSTTSVYGSTSSTTSTTVAGAPCPSTTTSTTNAYGAATTVPTYANGGGATG